MLFVEKMECCGNMLIIGYRRYTANNLNGSKLFSNEIQITLLAKR